MGRYMGRLIPSIVPCCVIGGCVVFSLPWHGSDELCLQHDMLNPQKLPQTDQLPEVQTSRLLLGDCVERLAELADNSVDCILTDPPYGYNYLSKSKKLPLVRIANDRADAYPLQDRALAAAYPKLKDGAWAFIFTNWQCYAPTAAIVGKYLSIKNVLIWQKNAWSRGDLKGNWGYEHEFIIAARKGATRVRRFLHGKREGNVLPFKKVPTQAMQHPTEKPVELLTYLIERVTQPGEVVLDMFAGVGSTGVAAQKAGRRSILIELQAEWAEVAAERLGVAVVQ